MSLSLPPILNLGSEPEREPELGSGSGSDGYNVRDIKYRWARKETAVERDEQISLPQFDIVRTVQKYRLEELSSGEPDKIRVSWKSPPRPPPPPHVTSQVHTTNQRNLCSK